MTHKDNLLSPEEVEALLAGPDDPEGVEGFESILVEFVHLIIVGAFQGGGLGQETLASIALDEAAARDRDEWSRLADEAEAWAVVQVNGTLRGHVGLGVVAGADQRGPGSLGLGRISALVQDLAARMGRLLGTPAGVQLVAAGAKAGARGGAQGRAGLPEEECVVIPTRILFEGGDEWNLRVILSAVLAREVVRRLVGEGPEAAAAREDDEPAYGPPAEPRNAEPRGSLVGGRWGRKVPEVRPAEFPPLHPAEEPDADAPDIESMLDLPLRVTVELGRTRLRIDEIMNLGPESVIELDRLAGEMVDVLVNGKLIAKGEVVVIDDAFGVKITDIVSPVDRLHALE